MDDDFNLKEELLGAAPHPNPCRMHELTLPR